MAGSGLFLCAKPFVAFAVPLPEREAPNAGLAIRAMRGPYEGVISMAEEREDKEFGGSETGENIQQPTGQQNQQAGDQGSQPSMSGQSSSGQTAPSSETLTADQESSADSPTGQDSSSQSEGFIGSQGSGSDELIQDRDSPDSLGSSSANATGGADFAQKGQGAIDDEEGKSDSTGGGGGF